MMSWIVETEENSLRDDSSSGFAAALWFVRFALPVGILLVGTGLASLFRRSPPAQEASLAGPREGILFRQPATQLPGGLNAPAPPRRIPSQPNRSVSKTLPSPSAVVLTSAVSSDPPGLPKSYPYPESSATRRGGMGFGLSAADARASSTQTHKIADGDTLPELARAYLGSASRASQIFQANRDVLTNPDILPIGAELKIPAER